MLSHATSETGRGWRFGLHEALTRSGAFLGPLLVSAVLFAQGGGDLDLGSYQRAFAILFTPALLGVFWFRRERDDGDPLRLPCWLAGRVLRRMRARSGTGLHSVDEDLCWRTPWATLGGKRILTLSQSQGLIGNLGQRAWLSVIRHDRFGGCRDREYAVEILSHKVAA